jgi:hypothetical protein
MRLFHKWPWDYALRDDFRMSYLYGCILAAMDREAYTRADFKWLLGERLLPGQD